MSHKEIIQPYIEESFDKGTTWKKSPIKPTLEIFDIPQWLSSRGRTNIRFKGKEIEDLKDRKFSTLILEVDECSFCQKITPTVEIDNEKICISCIKEFFDRRYL